MCTDLLDHQELLRKVGGDRDCEVVRRVGVQQTGLVAEAVQEEGDACINQLAFVVVFWMALKPRVESNWTVNNLQIPKQFHQAPCQRRSGESEVDGRKQRRGRSTSEARPVGGAFPAYERHLRYELWAEKKVAYTQAVRNPYEGATTEKSPLARQRSVGVALRGLIGAVVYAIVRLRILRCSHSGPPKQRVLDGQRVACVTHLATAS